MCKRKDLCFVFLALFIFFSASLFAQSNSPYSRYGLGDVAPNTNIINRGMGGISAGYSDILSVNFNNPASYSNFKMYLEERSQKPQSGRMLLDAGINIDSRTLRNPNQPQKFASTDAYFSYVQLGLPLYKNWGLSFGLRPLSRIGYKISRRELLIDPRTDIAIDSAFTEFSGTGGSFLPSIGTGVAIKNFSVGVNMGYLFGKKENTTKRALFNDTVSYNSSNHTTRISFGHIFFNAGAQYKINLNKQTYLRLGVAGNWQQNINASQDIIRETFVRDVTSGDQQLDSVYEQKGLSGSILYPASYTAGFVLERQNEKGAGWLLGADYIQNKWENFRIFNQPDSTKNNWQLRVGGQFRSQPARNYFSNVAYRAGFFVGPDYLNVYNKLPQFGITFGVGLPITNYNRLSPNQFTIVNLSFEYSRRGNNNNILKEDLFRISVGFNLSDVWFRKPRYD
ncbi:MAG: hypothetical protein ICV84_05320 [Flavisolibacter sp.]|nr:hypothetical protein [Flavisolibacter sp.]